MPRADADDPWEYIFPSRCYALAGLRLHLSVRRSPHVASALKPASATSLRYSASRRARIAPGRPLDAFCWQAENDALGVAAQGCSRAGPREARIRIALTLFR
jgi:hypothetical protein